MTLVSVYMFINLIETVGSIQYIIVPHKKIVISSYYYDR